MDGPSVSVNVAVVVGNKQVAAGAPLLEVLTDWIEEPDVEVVRARFAATQSGAVFTYPFLF